MHLLFCKSTTLFPHTPLHHHHLSCFHCHHPHHLHLLLEVLGLFAYPLLQEVLLLIVASPFSAPLQGGSNDSSNSNKEAMLVGYFKTLLITGNCGSPEYTGRDPSNHVQTTCDKISAGLHGTAQQSELLPLLVPWSRRPSGGHELLEGLHVLLFPNCIENHMP